MFLHTYIHTYVHTYINTYIPTYLHTSLMDSNEPFGHYTGASPRAGTSALQPMDTCPAKAVRLEEMERWELEPEKNMGSCI